LADHVLAEFAQGVLDPTELERVTGHLASCDACRRCAALAASAASEEANPSSLEATLPDAPDPLQGPQPGTRLGRYVVLEGLGQGGMGLVFRAYDPHLDRQVALKVLRKGAASERAVEGLLEEARVAGRLRHPNVVTVHDVGVDQGRAFVAMELVEGGSLARWLGAERRAPRQIVEVFVAAGEGLAAAHRAALVHRDFKPANVLMGSDGRPRVADFGLATETPPPATAADTIKTGTSASGTPGYMAPEQYFRKADARSDEFAFCVSLWEALTGTRPYLGDNGESPLEVIRAGRLVGTLPRSVARRIRRALRRGLSFNPEDRFLSMEALLVELRAPRSLLAARAPILLAAAALAATIAVARGQAWWPGPVERGDPRPAPGPLAGASPALPDVGGLAETAPARSDSDTAGQVEAAPVKAPAAAHRKKGRLILRINPWAEVSVDGRRVGTTPLAPIELRDGNHLLAVENPELGVRRTLTFVVQRGRDVTLRINLLE
jgi:predicted Ser/Thr protein kinase